MFPNHQNEPGIEGLHGVTSTSKDWGNTSTSLNIWLPIREGLKKTFITAIYFSDVIYGTSFLGAQYIAGRRSAFLFRRGMVCGLLSGVVRGPN